LEPENIPNFFKGTAVHPSFQVPDPLNSSAMYFSFSEMVRIQEEKLHAMLNQH
jgi:hypothetical protein